MTNKYLLSLNTGASYQLGDDMKGQNVQPILELEIETDAILDASTGLAI